MITYANDMLMYARHTGHIRQLSGSSFSPHTVLDYDLSSMATLAVCLLMSYNGTMLPGTVSATV